VVQSIAVAANQGGHVAPVPDADALQVGI
jgi:hypothetical protein